MAKNNKERVFGRTEMYRPKLEENRDKKEHSPYTPTFFGVGLVTVVCFMLLFVGSIGVASAIDWSAPVPDDRIQPLKFKVTDWPTLAEVIQDFESCHRSSEKDYNGDGSWGCGYCGEDGGEGHPLYRHTMQNVIGYMDAYHVTGKSIYKQRAKEGLDYLVREQCDNGGWIYWYGPGGSGTNNLYPCSVSTAALAEGYKLFNDQSYLNAAKKGADKICRRPNNINSNYDFFAAWALSSCYEITGDQNYLDRAIGYAMYGLEDHGKGGNDGGQLPNGGWSDYHNQELWYQGIITRGLVKLLSEMPSSHSNYDDIERATYKAVNHLRLRSLEDGTWLFRPSDSARHYWSKDCAQAAAMAVTELNWPVMDSVRLAAKGGKHVFGTGAILRAYSDTTPPPPPPPPSTGTIAGTVRELAQLLKSLFLNKIY